MKTSNLLTLLLALSLILSGVLVFSLLFENKKNVSLPSGISETLKTNSNSDVITDYHELLNLGLSETQAKRLVYDELKDTLGLNDPQVNDIYWANTRALKAASIRKKYAIQAQLRRSLIDLFGSSAEDNQVFSEVFRPLQSKFPFLTSDEQIAVQKIQFEHQIAIMSKPQIKSFSPTSGNSANPQQLAISPLSLSANVKPVLSDESALEYDLRASFLSSQLRESDVKFSEESFRKTYSLLADLFLAHTSSRAPGQHQLPDKTLMDRRADLEDLLGIEDSLKVIVTLDPEFKNLQRQALSLNLNEEQLMTAYELGLNARKALTDGIRARGENPEVGLQMIREAANNHWNQLSQQLGDEVAEQLLGSSKHRSRTQNSPEMTPQQNIIINN